MASIRNTAGNIYKANGYKNSGSDAISAYNKSLLLIEECQKAIKNPSAARLTEIIRLVNEIKQHEASSVNGILSPPVLGEAMGGVIERADNLLKYHNPDLVDKYKKSLGQLRSFEKLLKKDITQQCEMGNIYANEEAAFAIPENSSETTKRRIRRDPLVLDLDGDGLEISESAVYFDYSGNGIANRSSWVGADDGFLVFDKNNDGLIENGTELFGDDYLKSDGTKALDGFDALKDLDSNSDGVFNALDDSFSQVQIWRDLDQDGVTDDNELFSLSDYRINEISLSTHSSGSGNDLGGYEIVDTADIKHLDGSTSTIYDINLKVSGSDTEFDHSSDAPLAQDILDLPNVPGAGGMDSLHYAMSRNSALKALVEQFSNEDDYKVRRGITESILLEWAKTYEPTVSDIVSWDIGFLHQDSSTYTKDGWIYTTTVQSVDFQDKPFTQEISNKINIISLLGGSDTLKSEKVLNNNLNKVIGLIDQHFDNIINTIHQGLLQDRLNHYLNLVEVDVTAENVIDYSALKQYIETEISTGANLEGLFEDLVYLFNTSPIEFSTEGFNLLEYISEISEKLPNLQFFDELLSNYNFEFNENGLTYLNSLDNIVFFDMSLATNDSGNPSYDRSMQAYDNEKTISVLGSDDDDIIAVGGESVFVEGKDGNDAIWGSSIASGGMVADGGDGKDQLVGSNQGDVLFGGDGNDEILGNGGDDFIAGGKGNDYLSNSFSGTTTYFFERGDGQDYISNNHSGSEQDTLEFGNGIESRHLLITKQGHSIVIKLLDDSGELTQDQITLQSSLQDNSKLAGGIVFSDGSRISWSEVYSAASATYGTKDSETIQGTSNSDTIFTLGGDDVARGSSGDDTVRGGAGNDKLFGDDGNDKLYGDADKDLLEGGKGNDLLDGGDGQDTLTGNNGKDKLFGGLGDDTLKGGNGHDELNGGQGNDLIDTGNGSDKVIYNIGDGDDVIDQTARKGYDTLVLDDSLSLEQVIFSKTNSDLLITFDGHDGSILIDDWFVGQQHQIDEVKIGDKSLVSNEIDLLISAMASYDAPSSFSSFNQQDIYDNRGSILVTPFIKP